MAYEREIEELREEQKLVKNVLLRIDKNTTELNKTITEKGNKMLNQKPAMPSRIKPTKIIAELNETENVRGGIKDAMLMSLSYGLTVEIGEYVINIEKLVDVVLKEAKEIRTSIKSTEREIELLEEKRQKILGAKEKHRILNHTESK